MSRGSLQAVDPFPGRKVIRHSGYVQTDPQLRLGDHQSESTVAVRSGLGQFQQAEVQATSGAQFQQAIGSSERRSVLTGAT
jgi:hypothetical protein